MPGSWTSGGIWDKLSAFSAPNIPHLNVVIFLPVPLVVVRGLCKTEDRSQARTAYFKVRYDHCLNWGNSRLSSDNV